MKKILSFFVLACFSVTLFAQTFLVENFDGASMPTGWTIQNNTSGWSISNTNYAGGMPRELHLTWQTQYNGKTRVISPIINTTGATNMAIEFLQFLDNYANSHIIGIETTSDGGATWNLAFQKTFSSTQGSKILEAITTPDVGSATFQFCLFYQGNSYNINDWYFDNFKLFNRLNNDAALSSINNALYNVAGNQTVNVTVANVGTSTINTIEMRYQFNDLPAVTETFTSFNLQSLGSKTVSFTQPANISPGSYILKVEILTVNGVVDDDPSNNILTKNFYTATQAGTRKVCIEHFTSSTCTPCVSVNASMKSLLANNPDKFGITKYQMNWPGSGDPYYTAEGGVRRTYYGVNAVPMVFFNGKNNSVNQTVFNNAFAEPAFLDIDGYYSIDGNNIIINANVHSYLTIPEARVYIIVNEKRTTQNTGGNGETEFFHVMMKMVPDANGQTVNFTAGETKSFSHTVNMSSTKVEEMDDLEVHVFLQDHSSKYIFNSNFLTEYTLPAPTNFVAQQIDDDIVLTWEGEADSYNLFFNGVLLKDNISKSYTRGTTSYTHENVPAGEHIYGIQAVKGSLLSNKTETSIAVCGNDPENLTAQQQGNSFVLNWEAGYEGGYSFKVFLDGEKIAENIKTKTYTHQNAPGGEHTYGLLAVIGECSFNMVEKEIEVCVKPKNFAGQANENTVILTWENEYGANTIFFNGEILEENITTTTFTHENVPEGTHTYGIKAVGVNCITEMVETTVKVVLGIDEYESIAKIYPNPANNYICVEGNNIAEITVYNNVGQIISNISVNNDVTKINTKNFNSGIYLIQIKTKNGFSKSEKIIITK